LVIILFLLFLLLGWSYGSLGRMGTQVFFYLTLGGLGIWALIRLFTLSKAIKVYNKEIALKSGMKLKDMVQLGLV